LLVRFPLFRRSLDAAIRAWNTTRSVDDERWLPVEAAIRNRVNARLRRYRLPAAESEDMTEEVCLLLLSVMQSPSADHIGNFDAYVNRLIENVCKAQIRREKPIWTHLKAEIVETLRGRRGATGFALWRGVREELAGYADWDGRNFEATDSYVAWQQDARDLRGYIESLGEAARKDVSKLLAALFNWFGTPLPVNQLTSVVFDLQGLQEIHREAPEAIQESIPSREESVGEQVARSALMQGIAQAFGELPRPECAAFLFHLQPEVAERLLFCLSSDRDVETAITRLAATLQVDGKALNQILDDIPWRDLQIAAFLNLRRHTDHATQQEIINLRQRALRRMRRFLENVDLGEP
jgi:hypothetical protein